MTLSESYSVGIEGGGASGHAVIAGARDEHADAWTARITQAFVPLTASPVDDLPFFGRLQLLDRGPLQLAWIDGSAQRVRRGAHEMACASREQVYLNLQLSGTGHVRSRQGAATTEPGSGAVVCSGDGCELMFDAPFRQLCIAMPADWFAERLGLPAATLPVKGIDTRTPVGRVVGAAISGMIDAQTDHEAEACCDLFARALEGALHLSAETADRSPTPLLTAIRMLIVRRLGDPSLTPARAAQELGCSLSTLHLHCQKAGQSFGAMLMSTRLDAAAKALRLMPPHPGRVDRAALSCGFSDAAHFSRRFKGRFGVAPSAYV